LNQRLEGEEERSRKRERERERIPVSFLKIECDLEVV